MEFSTKLVSYLVIGFSLVSILSIFEEVDDSNGKKKQKRIPQLTGPSRLQISDSAANGTQTSSKKQEKPTFSKPPPNVPNHVLPEEEIQEILGETIPKKNFLIDSSYFVNKGTLEEQDFSNLNQIEELQKIIHQLQLECSQKEDQLKAEARLRSEAEENAKIAQVEKENALERQRREQEKLKQDINILNTKLKYFEQQQQQSYNSSSSNFSSSPSNSFSSFQSKSSTSLSSSPSYSSPTPTYPSSNGSKFGNGNQFNTIHPPSPPPEGTLFGFSSSRYNSTQVDN